MNRQSGWYWVKVKYPKEWIVRFYSKHDKRWYNYDDDVTDKYWSEINETRILSPDEKEG